ncbi:hypothetical protein NHX12_007174 [Muraenolepis orangiensis]|uniref:Uncharacterized protein n=1 Tax=Muraenolepis orangiensis TaxID=630683 RepID=A0A9Q0IAX5_9TELE|nr:hypothetical protein NHX12_007174 [Muraenolepis orangiensis]
MERHRPQGARVEAADKKLQRVVLRLRGRPNHFLGHLLTLRWKPSVVGYRRPRGARGVCGRMPCWYIQALNFPGRPDLSRAANHASSS